MIWTSYWGKLNTLPKDKVVSISRYTKFWNGERCAELMPSAALLKAYRDGLIDEKVYTYHFKWYLWKLDVHDLHRRLDGKILTCYEKHGFCHRHIVAEWFRHFGYECEEW